MKFKLLFSFLIAGASVASAQGFKDAMHYFRADQPEEAEIIIERVINEPSTDKAMANYFLGQIAYKKGNIENAKNFFTKGCEANPENAYNYVGLGAVALKSGDAKAADDYFKQAKKLAKKDAVVIVDMGRAYYSVDPVKYAKEIEKCIADARKANKQCPALYIFEADMLADQDKVGDAAGYYEMAMNSADKADYPEAFVKYARTYFKVNPKFAIDGLKELLKINPNSALAQRELAEKYYDNNQLTLAAEEYGKYVQNPNHFQRDEQRYVGLLYFGGKYDQSNEWADKILAKDPGNFFMKRMKFLNAAALKNNEAAAAAAEDFFSRTGGDFVPNDYTTYGEVLSALGNDSLSVIQYEKAVALDPSKTSLLKDLSGAYASADRFAESAAAFQKFIDAGDYTTNDLVILARRYQNAAATATDSIVKADYVDRGLKAINEVNEKVPNNVQVLNTKARIMLIGNNNKVNEELAAELKNILTLLDQDPANKTDRKSDYQFAYSMLGNYALDMKDMPAAYEYFSGLLELDPNNAVVKGAVEAIQKSLPKE